MIANDRLQAIVLTMISVVGRQICGFMSVEVFAGPKHGGVAVVRGGGKGDSRDDMSLCVYVTAASVFSYY